MKPATKRIAWAAGIIATLAIVGKSAHDRGAPARIKLTVLPLSRTKQELSLGSSLLRLRRTARRARAARTAPSRILLPLYPQRTAVSTPQLPREHLPKLLPFRLSHPTPRYTSRFMVGQLPSSHWVASANSFRPLCRHGIYTHRSYYA